LATAAPLKVHQHGPTQVRQFALTGLDRTEFPGLSSWPSDPRPLTIAAAAERRKLGRRDGLRVFEHVVQGNHEGFDPETQLHVDTFFSTHKLWLYLQDVNEEHAPLVYVPGSHKLSVERLRGDYIDSRKNNTGARRIDDEEVARRGLSRRLMVSRANTLVVVNTCGYHCRSVGQPGSTRRALHMSFRFNPFLPRFVRADERLTRRNPRVAKLLAHAGRDR
jgi:Phytanoyl-CoA dioxygenase (PhyH)